jgi:hypothetical protein
MVRVLSLESRRRRRTRTLVTRWTVGMALVLATLHGCSSSDSLMPPVNEEPFLFLLVAPTPATRGGVVEDSTVYALLLTTGTPLQSTPRTAERFTMTRSRDAAAFAWGASSVDPRDFFPSYRGVSMHRGGNYALAERAAAPMAGRTDLRALDTLTLGITTLGREIRGTTVIPAAPVMSLGRDGTRDVVHWPRSAGAAGYQITGYGTFPFITADTLFVLFELEVEPGAPPLALHVTALDTNAYRYLSDSTVSRAGLTGAYGVFGAINGASLRLDLARTSVRRIDR